MRQNTERKEEKAPQQAKKVVQQKEKEPIEKPNRFQKSDITTPNSAYLKTVAKEDLRQQHLDALKLSKENAEEKPK